MTVWIYALIFVFYLLPRPLNTAGMAAGRTRLKLVVHAVMEYKQNGIIVRPGPTDALAMEQY